MNELSEYDFREVGRWKLKEDLKSGIIFELDRYDSERVVYAFVVDDNVKYIGICDNDTTTLKDRMSRYKSLQGAGTNERVAKKIKERLEQGDIVKIYALKPELRCQYKDLNVDLVKGLENPLINKFRPDWNIQK